jgi:hypothetical protein
MVTAFSYNSEISYLDYFKIKQKQQNQIHIHSTLVTHAAVVDG